MRWRYYICDVFTDTRFGGNQLAVLPEAEGLSDEQMQQIAREFNFSETTFVLPAEAGHDRRVRIFTPPQEVPFAGHPNIGTAFVLATMGEFGPLDAPRRVTFEEGAGLVPAADGAFGWRIAQGVEMGRPSLLEARSEKRAGAVVNVWIGGESVMVGEGFIEA